MNPKLAAIQLDTIACEVNLNVHKAMTWTKRAFLEEAKYVFLHEGLTADYSPDPMRFGRPLDSPEVHGFKVLAKKHEGYVALGLNETWQGRPYISMVLIGPDGVIDVYRKSYLWPNPDQNKKDSFQEFLKTYVPYKSGYRLERSIIAPGDGTRVIRFGELRLGCLICADGSRPEAWLPFEGNTADLIFWQNNRGNVARDGEPQKRARELRTPLVATNRCGFSYHHFQEGGTCFVAADGSVVSQVMKEARRRWLSRTLKICGNADDT
jgi:predicted amidohydrolase